MASRVGSSRPAPTATATREQPPGPAPKMTELVKTQLATRPAANTALGRATNDRLQVATDVALRSGDSSLVTLDDFVEKDDSTIEPYHFHIYSHRHNCHITVSKPNRDAILSLSNGNLGFRKSQRKHYDPAYQLGAYVIDKLQQQGWHNKIEKLEVCLRGFGHGREAVTKVLLGNEGRLWRDKIVKVSDSTRLKFGGTRSKNPRRL